MLLIPIVQFVQFVHVYFIFYFHVGHTDEENITHWTKRPPSGWDVRQVFEPLKYLRDFLYNVFPRFERLNGII